MATPAKGTGYGSMRAEGKQAPILNQRSSIHRAAFWEFAAYYRFRSENAWRAPARSARCRCRSEYSA